MTQAVKASDGYDIVEQYKAVIEEAKGLKPRFDAVVPQGKDDAWWKNHYAFWIEQVLGPESDMVAFFQTRESLLERLAQKAVGSLSEERQNILGKFTDITRETRQMCVRYFEDSLGIILPNINEAKAYVERHEAQHQLPL